MVKGRVIVDNRFHQYQNELERLIQRALGHAAGVTKAVAQTAPTRYNLESIRSKIQVTPVQRVPQGFQVTVTDADWRARFFEGGTYQKLGRRLTARSREGHEGNRGVRPGHFMRKGRLAGRRALAAELQETLR